MKSYALKWEIDMSITYRERLLNLYAQGYFPEVWECIMLHTRGAIRIFVEEVSNVQFKFLSENFEWK